MPYCRSLLAAALLAVSLAPAATGQTVSGKAVTIPTSVQVSRPADSTSAATSSVTSYATPSAPRLVVVISIDQFRYDYLQRFKPWFSKGGFNRFLEHGAHFDHAFHINASTFTGPGHSVIGTGRTPSETGIVGNIWIDRNAPFDQNSWEWFFDDTPGFDAAVHPPAAADAPSWWARGGVPRYCVFDDRVRVSDGKTFGMSPVSLISDSLGDRLKEQLPGSRVMSAALKDRASILMAGRRADAAYWFDPRIPGFISSSFYRYNRSLLDFNKGVKGYIPDSGLWKLSGIIPPGALEKVTFDPPAAWKIKNQKYRGSFDHPVKDGWSLAYSPFANDMLLDFASSIIEREQLGVGSAPDLFFLGISTPDYLGHYYGPDSMEVADDAVRLDRSLEHFLDTLEKKFGDRILVAITADHGVQSNPEIARLRDPHIDAGRIDLRNAVRTAHFISELPPARIELERAVCRKLGLTFRVNAPLTEALVFFFEEPSLYLNWDRIRELKLDGERVKRAFREALLAMSERGIEHAYTNSELLMPNASATGVERAVRLAFRADRSGDLLITLRKNWVWSYTPSNTTHGQPLPDDQHVPLLLWGAGVKAGGYEERVAPMDLARTIGRILGVEAGSASARTLPCITNTVDGRSDPAVEEEKAPAPIADLRAILLAALAELDPGKRSFLIGKKIDAPAVKALESLRSVVPATPENELLPEGVARLDRVETDGDDKAYVTIWTGPIARPLPNVMSMSCGTGHTVRLHRDAAGSWTIESMSVMMC